MKRVKFFIKAFISSSKKEKYEARHKILSEIANLWGFRVYNKNLYWYSDSEYLEVWKGFSQNNGSIHERKYVLYQLAKYAANIEGHSAECGVYAGGSSYLICSAKKNYGLNNNSKHFVFDSFEGLSEPDDRDVPEDQRTFRWKKNDLSISEDVVKQNLKDFEFVEYFKGWIPSRFMEVSQCYFALVHIDVDLYQPTFESMNFFYSRMVRGGIIIIDDFGFKSCPGAYNSVLEFMKDKPEKIIGLTTGQGLIIKK